MEKQAWFRTIILVVGCLAVSSAAASQFTADVLISDIDRLVTGMIAVKDAHYRLDVSDGKEQVIIIVDETTGKVFALSVKDKEYFELSWDDPMTTGNDPIQGYKHAALTGEEKKLGSEMMNGHQCDKYAVWVDGDKAMTKWVATEIGFPIKIVHHLNAANFMELTNIRIGMVDNALFLIPEGYTPWVDWREKPTEIPAWAAEVPSAPVIEVPFERALGSGEMIRVKVVPGKSLKIKGSAQEGSGEAIARAILFRGGKPVGDAYRYSNLVQMAATCMRHEIVSEADEIVIRVEKGNATVSGKHQEMTERDLKEGGVFGFKLNPRFSTIETRIVNMAEGESILRYGYYSDGRQIPEDRVGSEEHRRIVLRNKGDVNDMRRSVNGDEVVFTVEKGEVILKLGQYDTSEF